MRDDKRLTRRTLLARMFAGACTVTLAGCQKLSETSWYSKVLNLGEQASRGAQKLILPRKALAQEFTEAERSPEFRSNGTSRPRSPEFLAMANNNFADYRLEVGGLVERAGKFSLAELREFPSRTQITRHDCVEGWSAIGKWKGVRLGTLLEAVHLKPEARYVVFHCADLMGADETSPYYESIDLEEAFHPQTILAYELNDQNLMIANGAPLRLRVERQLGYKMAKYVMRIDLVSDFSTIRGGKGGYWEDRGYEWYAGI